MNEPVGVLPRQVNESDRRSLAWYLSFAIPISIALVAIMGALVGYAAESHASQSNAFDNDAQVSSTYLTGHNDDALLTGQAAVTDHDLWEQLAGASGGASGGAGNAVSNVLAAEPACANVHQGAATVPAAQTTVDCQLAQVFSGFAYPAYWENGNPAAFNTQRFVGDWIALGNLGRDVAVSQHTAAADDQRNRELRLLWLGLLLALALAFCTLAQATVHHRWSKRPAQTGLLLATPGWVLLLTCSIVLLVWEL